MNPGAQRDERHRLREEDPHRVAQCERLLVRRSRDLHALQRGAGQLDRRVQRQRRELLALRLGDRLRLLGRELAQPAHEVLRILPEQRKTAFHAV